MSQDVLIGVAARDEELEQILELQRQNLWRTLSEREQLEEGFVFAEHDLPLLRRMAAELPQVIATHHGRVVGYTLGLPVSMRTEIAALTPMFEEFDRAPFRGRPVSTYRFMVGGQVCVRKDFRGRGLLRRLYHGTRDHLPPGYQLCVTEIATRNHPSLQAHLKMGFESVATYADTKERWTIVAWDLAVTGGASPGACRG